MHTLTKATLSFFLIMGCGDEAEEAKRTCEDGRHLEGDTCVPDETESDGIVSEPDDSEEDADNSESEGSPIETDTGPADPTDISGDTGTPHTEGGDSSSGDAGEVDDDTDTAGTDSDSEDEDGPPPTDDGASPGEEEPPDDDAATDDDTDMDDDTATDGDGETIDDVGPDTDTPSPIMGDTCTTDGGRPGLVDCNLYCAEAILLGDIDGCTDGSIYPDDFACGEFDWDLDACEDPGPVADGGVCPVTAAALHGAVFEATVQFDFMCIDSGEEYTGAWDVYANCFDTTEVIVNMEESPSFTGTIECESSRGLGPPQVHIYGYVDESNEVIIEFELGSGYRTGTLDETRADICEEFIETRWVSHDHEALESTIMPGAFADCWGHGTCCYDHGSYFGYALRYLGRTEIEPTIDDGLDEDTASPDPAACEDLDDWRVDSVHLSCSSYSGFEEDCGEYDTTYFDAMALCCACGGGTTGGDGTSTSPEDTSPEVPDPAVEDIELLGRWWDDSYWSQYTISNETWTIWEPEGWARTEEYDITFYDNTANYAIARNKRTAPYPGRWSRFDWYVSDGTTFVCQSERYATTEAEAFTPSDEAVWPDSCDGWYWVPIVRSD